MQLQEATRAVKTAVNRQTWLDLIGDPLQSGIRALYERTGTIGQAVQDFFNGTWLGHPLHPVITDVTVGALTAAVVLDGLEKTSDGKAFGAGADAALLLGVGSAVGAAASGLSDWQFTQGEARRIGVLHALLNSTSLVLYITSLIFRKKRKRGLGRNLALTGYAFSIAAAYLGGDLVYRQKIGVNHSDQEPITRTFKPILAADQLPEGKLVRAELDGKKILLVRRGVRIMAINETCAHMGGPLAEGELCSDDSVVCPWHASRFDLQTGLVIDGPSAYPQPRYEARENDGMIEIRQPPEVNG
jgi:nitrite reductase/ring-hydroxylating ferredoxin subunit/uncharacterized membrane protein